MVEHHTTAQILLAVLLLYLIVYGQLKAPYGISPVRFSVSNPSHSVATHYKFMHGVRGH